MIPLIQIFSVLFRMNLEILLHFVITEVCTIVVSKYTNAESIV